MEGSRFTVHDRNEKGNESGYRSLRHRQRRFRAFFFGVERLAAMPPACPLYQRRNPDCWSWQRQQNEELARTTVRSFLPISPEVHHPP
jgi:hypothetical protein